MSARELFRRVGVSERLYTDAFEPMLLVGLFAPGDVVIFGNSVGLACSGMSKHCGCCFLHCTVLMTFC